MKKISTYLFTVLRTLIGWHFLYEGISKLNSHGWTAKYYLPGSKWIFADLFHWIASSHGVLGADALYRHGGNPDFAIYNNTPGFFDELQKGIELIRSYGKPAGIGAHRVESIKACVEYGLKPNFWVKTLHTNDYWSEQVDFEHKDVPEPGYKDNIFCHKPQETIDYMSRLEQPWIAFKTLAAGALRPEHGFRYAFDNGADFICVGMYDFQIVEDVNIALNVLANVNRSRPCRG